MDNAEHAESSSSPNVNHSQEKSDRGHVSGHGPEQNGYFDQNDTSVQSIAGGAGKGVFRVDLTNGSSFFCSHDFILEHSLSAGAQVDAALFALIQKEDAFISAWKKGLSLVARSEHSEHNLKIKLLQREIAPSLCDEVVRKLVDAGFINNPRFGERWAAQRLRKHPESMRLLIAELQEQGLNRDEIDSVLKTLPEGWEAEALERAAEKLLRKRRMTKERFLSGLSRLGFNYGEITRYIHENRPFPEDDA